MIFFQLKCWNRFRGIITLRMLHCLRLGNLKARLAISVLKHVLSFRIPTPGRCRNNAGLAQEYDKIVRR